MKRSLISLLLIPLIFGSCNQGKEQAARIKFLETEIEHLQTTNSSLLDRLSDFAVIGKNDAESIKESLISINEQQAYISELTDKIHEKDSINFALVTNLKRSLHDINDEDVTVEVKGSAVYVSLSEKLLFPTASSKVNKPAYRVLEKLSKIINDHADVDVLVQGHTDDVPISNRYYKDNWDLSVRRATSVVRVLTDSYGVYPERLTAAGKGEYLPLHDNDTREGRGANRRTEIIITPKLSKFFELLEAPELMS